MPEIIVNADDFGKDPAVNQGIICSFREGFISSATVMANMPGFENACQLAREHNVMDKIGLHFNITQGKALTSLIQNERRFCDSEGNFAFSKRNGLSLSRSEQTALAEELTAQWNKCRDAGIEPSHLDSHHHIHTVWGIAQVIIDLSKKLGIRAVRRHWNIVPPKNLAKRIYFQLVQAKYCRAGLEATAYAAMVPHASHAICSDMTPLEIMVHPSLVDGIVIDTIERKPIREIFENFHFSGKLYSYRDVLENRIQS